MGDKMVLCTTVCGGIPGVCTIEQGHSLGIGDLLPLRSVMSADARQCGVLIYSQEGKTLPKLALRIQVGESLPFDSAWVAAYYVTLRYCCNRSRRDGTFGTDTGVLFMHMYFSMF